MGTQASESERERISNKNAVSFIPECCRLERQTLWNTFLFVLQLADDRTIKTTRVVFSWVVVDSDLLPLEWPLFHGKCTQPGANRWPVQQCGVLASRPLCQAQNTSMSFTIKFQWLLTRENLKVALTKKPK